MTILEKMRETLSVMSPTSRSIALYILDHGPDAAFSTIYDISKATGVSNATLIRFTRSLGFRGYADFKHALQEDVKATLDPYQKIALSELDTLSGNEQFDRLVQNEINNLKKTLYGLELDSLGRIVQGIQEARSVFLSGFGVTRHLVQSLEHSLLSTLDKNIVMIMGSISDFSPSLRSFREGDVLLLCTFPPYSLEGSYVAKVARERKGKVFLFSDSLRCPSYPLADEMVLCVNNSMLLMNSFVGLVAVLQIIANLLCLKQGESGACQRDGMYKLEAAGYRSLEQERK